ncbi:MAG: hypothetical protein QXS54_07435 [Candidatus Methanomethylicaceae archaeon]
MSGQNLDQIAWDYLMGSPRNREVCGTMLVHAGAAAVFPLLRAGVQVVHEFNPLRTRGVKPLDRQAAESTWIFDIAKPMLADIYAIVSAIGQPAYDALCRALWTQDEHLKILVTAVLMQELYPTPRTTQQIREAFYQIISNDRDKRYFRESGIAIALSHILAQGGDAKHQQVLREWAASHQMSEEQVLEASRNTLLLYLIR